MRIIFRVDASLEIGTGHVMRCLTLARALREEGASCRFITRAHPGNLADRITAEGYEVALLPAPQGPVVEGPPAHASWAGVDWARDAEETRAVLGAYSPDWLVLDHYAFDARWQNAVRLEGFKLMVIDDLADRPHVADLLLDQNLGRKASDYDGLLPASTIRLIGPRFALLRPEFAEVRTQSLAERAGRDLQNVLISMGGVDSANATTAVLLVLRDAPLPADLRITVIMGPEAPWLSTVRDQASRMPFSTIVVTDVRDMAGLMAQAELAIGGAGSTAWERCCLGLPTILLILADNQEPAGRALAASGAAILIGDFRQSGWADVLLDTLTSLVNRNLLQGMSCAAANLVDGLGTMRTIDMILNGEH